MNQTQALTQQYRQCPGAATSPHHKEQSACLKSSMFPVTKRMVRGLSYAAFDHPQWGSYLAGLWEGDGHIILPKINPSGKCLNTPCLAITFANVNEPFVKKLVEKHGGWIRRKVKERALVYTITKESDLLNVIQMMNGFLRTPKIDKFNALMDYLRCKHKLACNASGQLVDRSPLYENYWLAGFVDADGGFKIRYTAKQVHEFTGKVVTKERIEVRFSLEQRQFDSKTTQNSYEGVIEQIATYLGVNLRVSNHQGRNYWIVEVFSLPKLEKLVDYLTKYPLCTAKVNDYKDWLKAFHIVREGRHLTQCGKSEIVFLKSNMNRKRTVFDWSHLS